MNRVVVAWSLAVAVLAGSAWSQDPKDSATSAGPEVPEAFQALEHLVGGWKGTEIPKANRLKGVEVKHDWAWKFDKGKVAGMAVRFEKSAVLAKADLTFDATKGQYTLKGADPAGKPVTFVGTMDDAGKSLTLTREGADAGVQRQLVIRVLPDNLIRYTIRVNEKRPGSPQFALAIESGLTRMGESLGSSGAPAPKCIITGGAATITVSYQGKSYPVCCSGCAAEFDENPEKYVRRAEALAAAGPASKKSEPATSKPKPAEPDVKADEAKSKTNATSKARSALRLAESLEKQGNKSGAISYYKRIVKDHPKTDEAKTARDRIKALEGP